MNKRWTPERRAEQAAAVHQWKPWDNSSGPRTPEGKAVVARNAYKGGKRVKKRQMMREYRNELNIVKENRELVNQIMKETKNGSTQDNWTASTVSR